MLLRELIAWGRAAGYAERRLETGDLQPEAIHLYESEGFVRLSDFGYDVGIGNSRCYALKL